MVDTWLRNRKITVLIHGHCERCEMKLASICGAVEESTNIPEVSWDKQNLMTRDVYIKITEDIIRQAVLSVWKLNRYLTAATSHENMYTGGTKPHEQVHTLGHV